jgi:acyl-CoA reductase-like NAD-dependent aldehyde dehydrogenase
MTEMLLIGGERAAAADGATFDVNEPAEGAPMVHVAQAGPEDARRAIDVATRAFEAGTWPNTPARQRGRVLLRASMIVRDRLEELAPLEARNVAVNLDTEVENVYYAQN